MKNIFTALLAGSLFAAGFTAGAQSVKFIDEVSSWKQSKVACEKAGDNLRINVVANARGNYGQFWKYIPPVPNGKYIQVKVDAMENSGAFCWVQSPSSSVKRSFGVLFAGINTFAPQVKTSFAWSFNLNGAGKNVGSWITFNSYDISAAPENSLVALKEPAEGALKVGDTLSFKIFRSTPCANPVKIRIFVTAHKKRALQNFQLAKERSFDAVYNEADKCYTASVKVSKDAFNFDSDKDKMYMVAAAELDGLATYYTMPFAVKIATANKIPTALFTADSPSTRENRQAWFDLTSGKKNLALKKTIQFMPKGNYHLTQDKKGAAGNDATDLTDGSITKRASDTIWFDRKAVGFYGGVNTVFMRLDLGSIQPVDYIALRALGGSESGFRWPKKFEVYVSRDNDKFYRATEMVKLAPAEAYQSDFVKTYYYPENRKWAQSVCKTFKLLVNADARYVIVKLTLDKHFFSDEMAVIAAEKKDANFNLAYEGSGFAVPQDSLTAQPRLPELAVVKGVAAPQAISISDYRIDRKKIKKAEVVVELPEELTIFKHTPEKITLNGKKYHRYRIPTKKDKLSISYLYILSNEQTPDQLPPANIYVEYDGKTGFKQTLPIKVVTLPEFETFKKMPVCLSWMTTESYFDSYPDLLKNYKRFGFNGAGVFPRFWIRNPKADPSDKIRRYEEIRKAGLKLYMNDSAMHEMIRNKKAGHEVYCITKQPGKLTCPSYTGVYYQKEMERIARCVVMSKPEHVLLDIECFNYAFRRSTKECSRCVAAIKASGLSDREYIYSCGKRMISDIAKAVEKGAKEANIPVPQLHMYDLDRLDNSHGITRFTDLYPDLIKSSQPSLYIGGHPPVIQKNIRANYKLIGKKDILPWLSTGCYGEYDSYLVEPIVLEAFMNGAGGVLNYAFNHFADSPLDFYYHALAVMKLAPYEELLLNCEHPEITGSNDKMFYSMAKRGNELLLLVGNYYRANPETTIKLPFAQASVLDLNTKEKSTAGSEFKINVEPGKFNLYYIKGK